MRIQKALPVYNLIGKWISQNLKNILPKSTIGKAMQYTFDRWDELGNYMLDELLEIGNNLVENAIRPVAMGCKNYLLAGTHESAQSNANHVLMPSDANSWSTYGEEWANVSNTPFRSYKQYTHEGGIASPLIVHWPKGIPAKGQLRTQSSHLIDIMATCLAIMSIWQQNTQT